MGNSYALTIKNLTKTLHDNHVLRGLDFAVEESEIHAILGLNETGKTTLVKIIAGLIPPDSGEFYYYGKKVKSFTSNFLKHNGGEIVYDQSYLFPHFSVAHNVCFQPDKLIRLTEAAKHTQEIFDKLQINIDPTVQVNALNRAQKKLVDFARIMHNNPRFVLLDEPFELLSAQEIIPLIKMLKELRDSGGSVLITCHRLHDVIRLADRVSILSGGKIQKQLAAEEITVSDILSLLSDNKVSDPYPKINTTLGRPIMQVRNLSIPQLMQNISFDLHEGEILGFHGDSTSGRNVLGKTIFGAMPDYYGHIFINGARLRPGCPEDAVKNGIAYVPEDPYSLGIFSNLNVINNLFSVYGNISGRITYDTEASYSTFNYQLKQTNLLPRNPDGKMHYLSAGMVQKINLLKWFFTQSKIFIFDEPTINVDSIAKVDIYNLLNDLIKKGAGVMLISSDIYELAGMCDRIIILENGKISAELNPKEKLSDDIFIKGFI